MVGTSASWLTVCGFPLAPGFPVYKSIPSKGFLHVFCMGAHTLCQMFRMRHVFLFPGGTGVHHFPGDLDGSTGLGIFLGFLAMHITFLTFLGELCLTGFLGRANEQGVSALPQNHARKGIASSAGVHAAKQCTHCRPMMYVGSGRIWTLVRRGNPSTGSLCGQNTFYNLGLVWMVMDPFRNLDHQTRGFLRDR